LEFAMSPAWWFLGLGAGVDAISLATVLFSICRSLF
jgi:hypothetical protein